MTTKSKTPKAPAKATAEKAWPSHRDVVMTVTQRDEINDILHLIQTIDLAVRGSELGEYERLALLAVVGVVETRVKTLIKEFDAFAEGETHDRAA
jgi:hypothetical protein